MIVRIDRDPRLISGQILAIEAKPITINDFDEDDAKRFRDEINRALEARFPIIPVIIDSFGGRCHGFLSMLETLRSCPVPVATIGIGKMMSAGFALLACGDRGYRYASPLSHLMMHRVSTSSGGPVPVVKEDINFSERLDRQIFELIAANSKVGVADLYEKMRSLEGADWYLTPHEALALGFIDRVGVPTLKIDVGVCMELVDAVE